MMKTTNKQAVWRKYLTSSERRDIEVMEGKIDAARRVASELLADLHLIRNRAVQRKAKARQDAAKHSERAA
jgi:hypothetical protein